MTHPVFLTAALFSFCLAFTQAHGQAPNAPTEKVVYKTANEHALQLWVWKPADWKTTDKRNAIVFYHGGGWRKGSPTAFSRQSARLAEKGMVAISVQYRLMSVPGVEMDDCVRDARSAFRWVRSNAARLGIDPDKIAAGGGSAGGHLAACLSTIELDEPADDLKVSTRPAALVLFNPAANLDFPRARQITDAQQAGTLFKLSPYHHLKAGHPPVILFHGEKDTTVPISSVQVYADKINELGGEAELVRFPGQQHSFFNKEPFMSDSLKQAEAFLQKHGLLNAAAP